MNNRMIPRAPEVCPLALVENIIESERVSAMTARALIRRGVSSAEEARRFLHPSELSLHDFQSAPMGTLTFVYAVAPHHPLAAATHSLRDEELREHRAVAVADSTQRGRGVTHNLLPGQDVLTVPTMQHKLEAQLRGLGGGFLPLALAQPFIDTGRLVVKSVQRPNRSLRVAYAWRQPGRASEAGRALRWWLDRLQHPKTRSALLNNHHSV